MIADTPLGAFLSGGIDSSTVVAIMQAQSARPVETFTIGFAEAEFDEAPFAREMARHLGTSHHEMILSGQDALDLVQGMPGVYDEPFADPSQLPTWLVARFTRSKVTVALSGDAGDELFAGYGRYHSIDRKWNRGAVGIIERLARGTYEQALLTLAVKPAESLGLKTLAGNRLAPLRLRLEENVRKFFSPDAITAYERSFTVVDEAHRFVLGGKAAEEPLLGAIKANDGWSVLDQAGMLDIHRYLPDDILVKVDRAAMAHGLETRVPLLDPDIARFAWSLPDTLKRANGERKGLLKAVLSRYAPRDIWDRPKRGFGIPVAQWLRGPLRELGETLFARNALATQGLFDVELTRGVWEDFLAGGQRRTNLVWTLFVAQLYLARGNIKAN